MLGESARERDHVLIRNIARANTWMAAIQEGRSFEDIVADAGTSKRRVQQSIMREIRRRTRVVGAFPDGQSCLNLAAARLRHIAGTQWSTRKYMNMAPLHAAKNEAYGAVIA